MAGWISQGNKFISAANLWVLSMTAMPSRINKSHNYNQRVNGCFVLFIGFFFPFSWLFLFLAGKLTWFTYTPHLLRDFVFGFACLDYLFELFGLVTPEKTSQPIIHPGVSWTSWPLTHWRLKRKYYVLSGILSSKSLLFDFICSPIKTIKSQKKLKNIANLLKSKYNTIEYDCVIRKVNKSFFKPSGFKYDQYCQEYIHFSSRRHTKEITSGYEKVLALQKPIPVLIKKERILIRDKF